MARLTAQDKKLLTSAAGWLGHFGGLFVEGLIERGVPHERIHALVTEDGREDLDRVLEAALHALAPKGFITVDVTVEDLDHQLREWATKEPEWREVEGPGRYTFFVGEFLKKGEDNIVGEEMLQRAVGITATYAMLWSLKRNWQQIPEELRGKVYFVAPQAVVRHSFGRRLVAYLGTDGDVRWNWLDNDFDSRGRLLGSRKVS